ncbi:MAG: hypothetical protein ACREA0_26620, partial [bacterium]
VLLLTDGIEKTSRFIPSCQGIDTARLVAESQACLDQIIALGPSRLKEFEWERVPFVHFVDARSDVTRCAGLWDQVHQGIYHGR